MRIDLAAFNSDGSPATHSEEAREITVGIYSYPKNEPVLESSHLFPRVESYGLWHCNTSVPIAVPKNR